MRRLRPHLSYADVMVTLLAIGALTGGVAYAANTIGSADVINESLRSQDLKNDNVTGDDVLESSLKQGTTWRLVGAAGQPAFGDTESCDWSNYDSVHSSAAFTRDAAGFVHLKGTLKTRQGPGVCDDATERAVFVLPPGYRPQKRESMPVAGDMPVAGEGTDLSAYIDGPALAGSPAGGVSIAGSIINADYVSIDGISFRCSPAGVNGCP